MGLKRRTFLQQAGLALAALGLNETVLSLLGDKSLGVHVLDRYFQALAQPGGRKLALLVGINQYPISTALGGCVTDVELQRELLIHRFGFNSSDILTLTDSQASRENIETAFVEHLTEQAKPGDVVIFHFSGYGSRVKINEESQLDNSLRLSNSLVPIDGLLPTKDAPVANDLLEETLVLLLRSLATDRVTTILDTSHTKAGVSLQGNLRVRSCPNPPAESPSPGELAFQEQILRRLNLSGEQLKNSNTLNQIPGIVLVAAGPSQLATEAQWNGFRAGLFTYALTQHLWQAAPATTVQVSLSRAAGMVNQLVGKEQQPRLINQKSLHQPLFAYYLPPDPSIGADGVVTAVEDNGKTVSLWLAGLPVTVLEYYGTNSLLSLAPSKTLTQELKVTPLKVEGALETLQPSNPEPSNPEPSNLQPSNPEPSNLQPSNPEPSNLQPSNPEPSNLQPSNPEPSNLQPSNPEPSNPEPSNLQPSNLQPSTLKNLQLQMRSKVGLTAKARIVGSGVPDNYPIPVGQLIQEAVRVLPRNLRLTVALDATLERIERVDATSAFATIASVSSVVVAGEQPADYVLGRVQEEVRDKGQEAKKENPDATASTLTPSFKGGYGLFYLARDPIRNTAGDTGEAVKSAVNRLTPKLRTLLAAKWLRLTANEGSSRLGIRVSLEIVAPQATVVMQRETLRASSSSQGLSNNKTNPDLTSRVGEGRVPTLPIGSRIQYRLENYSDRPIYFMLLGLDTSSNAIALYKIQSSEASQESPNKPPLINAAIAPGQTLTLPQSPTTFNWVVSGPAGLAEIQLICSREPFTNAIAALELARRPKGEGELIGDLFNPLDVAQAVLQDLHQASAVSPDLIGTASDTYALDVNAWATLSFIYQVV